MECLFIDLIGPLPRTKVGNQYILVVVDSFTKFVWINAIRDSTCKRIIYCLEHVVYRLCDNYGMPKNHCIGQCF